MKTFHKNANTNVLCEPYYSFVLSWMLNWQSSFFILQVKCWLLLFLKIRKDENFRQLLPVSWKNSKICLIKRKKIESKKGKMLRKISLVNKINSCVLVWYIPLFLNEMVSHLSLSGEGSGEIPERKKSWGFHNMVMRLMRKAVLMSM